MITDKEQWKNYDDYVEIDQDVRKDTQIIFGFIFGGLVLLGMGLLVCFVCKKTGYPITCADVVLSIRRQYNVLKGRVLGRHPSITFNPTSAEMERRSDKKDENEGSNLRVTIGSVRSNSWPLVTTSTIYDSSVYPSSPESVARFNV